MSEHVKVSRSGRVLEIVIDKPKANAIDIKVSQALGEAFVTLRDDPDLAVAIITGAGERIFCAGWDLKAVESGEMSMDNWWEDDYGPGGFAGITELWDLNKPVIAALNGITLGGGVEIMLACDLIIAAEHVELGLPEMPLGIVPDAGAIQRLPRRLPYNKAMEMLLIGTGGCSTYDVLSMLKKSRQNVTDCQVEIEAERADAVPAVFTKINLHFVVKGVGLKESHVSRAVKLSAEKYCSASIMLGAAGVEVGHSYEIVESGIA